jgi:hypothetical protein
MGNGAHVGRGELLPREAAVAIEKLAGEIAEAVARGEFERARQLTEAAIRLRTDG